MFARFTPYECTKFAICIRSRASLGKNITGERGDLWSQNRLIVSMMLQWVKEQRQLGWPIRLIRLLRLPSSPGGVLYFWLRYRRWSETYHRPFERAVVLRRHHGPTKILLDDLPGSPGGRTSVRCVALQLTEALTVAIAVQLDSSDAPRSCHSVVKSFECDHNRWAASGCHL